MGDICSCVCVCVCVCVCQSGQIHILFDCHCTTVNCIHYNCSVLVDVSFNSSATAPGSCSPGDYCCCQSVHAHCQRGHHSGFIRPSVLLCSSNSQAEETGGS